MNEADKIVELLMPDNPDRATKSIIGIFARWMLDNGLKWNEPKLALWKAEMVSDGKSKHTIKAYTQTVRRRYKECITIDGKMRSMLYSKSSGISINDNEEWLDIPGFPGYKVSNQGRIASYKIIIGSEFGVGPEWDISEKPQRLLKPAADKKGYRGVNLMDADMKQNFIRVNTLVLLSFVGPCPDGLECCHNDSNPNNNRLDNLRYDTHQGNMNDRCPLSPELLTCLRYQVANGERVNNLIKAYDVDAWFIKDVCSGRSYSTLGSGPITKKEDMNTSRTSNYKIIRTMQLIQGGMFQKEAARIVGVHESTVSR